MRVLVPGRELAVVGVGGPQVQHPAYCVAMRMAACMPRGLCVMEVVTVAPALSATAAATRAVPALRVALTTMHGTSSAAAVALASNFGRFRVTKTIQINCCSLVLNPLNCANSLFTTHLITKVPAFAPVVL